MKRFLFWLVAGVAGLILLALIGVGIYTHTEHFHAWARTQILTALRSTINGEFTFERLSGSFWNGLSFHNLSIQQHETEVIRVSQGSFTFDVLAQIRSYFRSSTVQVSAITLQDPVLTLTQNAQGEWNLSRLLNRPQSSSAEPSEPSSLSFLIDRLQLTNGHINVTQADGTITQLTPFTLAGALAVRPAGMRLDLSNLAFGLARTGVPHLQWDGGITYDTTALPARLSLANVDLRTGQSHVRVSGTVQNLPEPVLALTANVEHLAVVDLRALSPAIPLQQDLTGEIKANGPLSALEIVATAQAPDGMVTTHVTTNLTQTPVQYEGTVAVKELHIPKAVQLATNSGIVSGQSTFVGRGNSLEGGTFAVTVSDLHVGTQAIGTVTTSGKVDNQQVQVTGKAQGAVGDVDWQGQIGLQEPLSYDVNLKARNLAAERVMPQPPSVPVTLNLDAHVHGSGTSWQNLNSAIVATLLPSRIGNLTDVQGQFNVSVRDEHLTVNTLSLVAQDTTLTAQGELAGLQTGDAGTLTYSLESKNITPWLALVGQSGGGAIQTQGKATGTLAALQITGSATVTNLRVANTSLQNGSLTYAGSGIGGPRAQGQATAVAREMTAGIQWQSARLQLAVTGTQPLTAQIDFSGQDAAQRRHRAKAQVRYAPERIEAVVQEVAAQLPTGVWRTPQPASVSVENQTLHIERLQLQRGNHAIIVNGTLSTRGTQDAQIQIARLSLAEVRALLGSGPDVDGELSTTMRVQGTAAQPRINAEVTTSALKVAGQEYAGLTAQIAYQEPQVQLSALLRQDDVHTLSLEGGIQLALSWADAKLHSAFGEADVRLYSQGLSLAFLNQWSSEVQDIQGTVRADARVKGPLSALTASGSAQLQDGRVRVPKLGIRLTELSADAVLTTNAVQLTTLQARSGKGRLTGSGTIGLARGADAPVDLTLRAETFQVVHTDQYTAALSGRLLAAGSIQSPVVTGELTVEDTALRPELALLKGKPPPPDPTITVVRGTRDAAAGSAAQTQVPAAAQPNPVAVATSAVTAAGSGYERLSLDVTVNIPRGTWVNVEDGAVEFRGDVRVRKAAYEAVVLVGTLEAVRGWYDYRGRKFRIEQGYIYFTGATPIDPGLDVVARYTLREYRIDVIVGGTAREPQLTLRSEPALEQADILSLVMFGKTTAGLSSGEKVSLQSQALQTAAGYLANDLRQSLAKELGVDNLELDVGQTLNQSRIGAGKYVTDDVFVSTSQQLSDASNREFAVEYSISENWQLKASTTTRGNDGIDVFWQKRY